MPHSGRVYDTAFRASMTYRIVPPLSGVIGRKQSFTEVSDHQRPARHPLTLPATNPATIHFWQKTKKMKTGISAMVVIVMNKGQFVVN